MPALDGHKDAWASTCAVHPTGPRVSAVTEDRCAFAEESVHAFLLAIGCECRLEQPPLVQYAFGQTDFLRAVHGFLGHPYRRCVVAVSYTHLTLPTTPYV